MKECINSSSLSPPSLGPVMVGTAKKVIIQDGESGLVFETTSGIISAESVSRDMSGSDSSFILRLLEVSPEGNKRRWSATWVITKKGPTYQTSSNSRKTASKESWWKTIIKWWKSWPSNATISNREW